MLKELFNEGTAATVTTVVEAPKSMSITFQIFLWMSVVFIISLSLPQLFKLIKEKRTGNVSFLSFWIFHIGILLWVIWGATNQLGLGMLNVMIADGISLYVNGIMTILLYYHKKEFTVKQKVAGYVGVGLTWVLGAMFIAFYCVDMAAYSQLSEAAQKTFKGTFQVAAGASTAMGFIFPAFTTLAFTPQLIQSFKTNEWQGVTYWMYVLYVVNNIIWIVWWGLGMGLESYKATPNYGSLIAGMVWQVISLTIFSIQLGFTLYDKALLKKGVDRTKKAA
ncbi:PQ-loop domain-containing transporter [Mycoplasma seminis]|uniref:PQ-loop domain-containing transporter n=1 Tax=Mycoplasma seminis TaxID=512749 RepID=A0ABY9HBL8_9MOLU|nr:PQ-loop domain-containing transporter [Mycoplasma seminis]WLP85575.1 PQ-loop domain-containing transporter [Mycoplasma seminis]